MTIDTGTFRPAPSAGELRSGEWTRLGDERVLGDRVTEEMLSEIAIRARPPLSRRGMPSAGPRAAAAAEEQSRVEVARLYAEATAQEERRQQEHEATIDALRTAVAEVRATAGAVCDALESQATDLALKLTEAILGRELQVATDPGADAVRRALQTPSRRVARHDPHERRGSSLHRHLGAGPPRGEPGRGRVPGAWRRRRGRRGPRRRRQGGYRTRSRSGGLRVVTVLFDPPVVAAALRAARPERLGRVSELLGLHLLVTGLEAAVGDLVEVLGGPNCGRRSRCERAQRARLSADDPHPRDSRSARTCEGAVNLSSVAVGPELLGRVLDGFGRPIDGGPSIGTPSAPPRWRTIRRTP